MLQSCATLQYFMPEKKFVYSAEETQTPSPYNTYIHKGLPIGPICSPGKAAIEAALWPDKQFMAEGYLVFLCRRSCRRNDSLRKNLRRA